MRVGGGDAGGLHVGQRPAEEATLDGPLLAGQGLHGQAHAQVVGGEVGDAVELGLVEDDVYWGTLLGILEMLRAGVTCYNDMYHYPGAGVRAAIDGGIRALPSGVLLEFVDERRDVSSATEFALQTRETSPERIVPMLGPHAPYSCTPEMLTEVAEAALEHGFSIHIHLSETVNEVEQVEQQTGMKPVAYLEKLGVLDAHVTAAHCVHLDDDEIAVLAERGVGIVHCPTSNMKLASGFARVPDMLERGAIVGLGTDGASSNNRLDMLGEARMAALIHKGYAGDPGVVNARQALDMATIGAARAILDLPARPRRTVAYPIVAPDEHPTPAAILKLRHAAVHRAAAHRRR